MGRCRRTFIPKRTDTALLAKLRPTGTAANDSRCKRYSGDTCNYTSLNLGGHSVRWKACKRPLASADMGKRHLVAVGCETGDR